MAKNLKIKDFSIVIAVRDHNPDILTYDFLKSSGAMATDWELARPPVLSDRSTKIVLKNGIRIKAKSGNVSVSEGMVEPKTSEGMKIAELVSKYAAALPNLDYRAVGIKPRLFATFGDSSETAHKYITEKILSPGAWQEVGDKTMQTGINIMYSLNKVPLRLNIKEAKLQMFGQEAISSILFSGNFHHDLVRENEKDKLNILQNQLKNWQTDWDAFQDILATKFLNQTSWKSIMAA
ncbi:hypothetical protein Xen7305DRAFT_00053910 [Xenococcus sp. PCC 7305]|uniref:hypothetical protein n=1 Tax=Xenococcus sp. PCC 7305 TaxID=102125 RepID=UPI0002AD12CC|nr:hypothetical protein [Xenococcus sp. PCC 7305]ELS05641.1 hypothetical protein Xen7305DRAFT_00053910 [Xenococcus sp. PCC 7305]